MRNPGHPIFHFLLCVLLGITPALPIHARTIEGVSFAPKLTVGQTQWNLKSTALGRHAFVFKVGVAALYGPEQASMGNYADPNLPKRLEIEYLMDIPARRLVQTAEKTLREQHSPQTLTIHQADIRRLHSLYRDVGPGDRYALVYHPQTGLDLELNGNRQGRFTDPDFAALYFGIWLGENPVSPSLRAGLLNP